MAERLPMGIHIAFSAAFLETLGVPDNMSPDDVAECVDRALLEDSTALQWEIQQWIEDREADNDAAAAR